MKPAYQKWIDDYVRGRDGWQLKGYCVHATRLMVDAFPELKIVKGHCGFYEHAWCVTPDGEIVDPTAGQFEGVTLIYKPFQPGDVVKVGRCMNCGDPIYDAVESLDDPKHARNFCDDECKSDFEGSFTEMVRGVRGGV